MELKGTGFTLRGFCLDDTTALQKHADNINISRYLFDRFPSPYTMADAEAFVSRKLNQEPLNNFVIDINNELAGVIGVDRREDIYRKAPLLGYWLAEEYWGRGIMTEAITLVAAYAFANLDIVRLQSGVLSNNPASARVLEKAGFVREGFLRSNIIKSGVVMDELIYGMVKD